MISNELQDIRKESRLFESLKRASKATLTILFLTIQRVFLMLFFGSVFCVSLSATDYYISSSGNDSNNGLSESSAWRSISKVNSTFSSFQPGDRILFRRGDTFYGTLKITKSGISGSPITISCYGAGNIPILTGFTTISNWIYEGNNIYSKIISSESPTNMVTVNNINTGMGRFPNSGFLTYESCDNVNYTITDIGLSDRVNWRGAEAVIRKNDWNIERCIIRIHSGDKLDYDNLGTTSGATPNYGYFIQNDLRTLDMNNEWYHDFSTGKFYVYGDPSVKVLKVATLNYIIYNSGCDFITIENLSFEGSIVNAIYFTGNYVDNTIIQNCVINYSGSDGISMVNSCRQSLVNNNTIKNSSASGIKIWNGYNNIITNNKISNSGIINGASYIAYRAGGIYCEFETNILIQNNHVEYSANNGIFYRGNGGKIKNNLVNYSVLNVNDGGGIYTGNSQFTGRVIEGNIVMNSIGNYVGTPTNRIIARGIYLDEYATDIDIINNIVFNCNEAGIMLHKAYNIVIENNTTFNNSYGILLQNSSGSNIRNITMNNNIFFAKAATQHSMRFISVADDIRSFGTAKNNYYARPIDDDDIIYTYEPSTGSNYRTLASWQSFTGQDLNSHKSPITLTDTSRIDFYYNASTSNRVITLPQPMIDVKGTKYSTSITLLPYTSAVLMVDPNPAAPAVPVYTGSLISGSSPALLEISYNLTLASSAPPPSAFVVNVNSTPRSVGSVSVSGNKVLLTLSSPVAAGDAVTIAYTRPSTNPIQTSSGGVAASFTAQPVNNQVSAPVPVYVSSVIQNAAPGVVEMTYSLTLANIVPSASAFDVRANGVNRPVGSVAIASDKVRLTLTYPLIYGDVVTVTYTAPSTNPLQTSAGGRAASISARPVTNNISPPYPVFVSASVENSTPTILSMVYSLSLASVSPPASAFTVTVNSVARTVNSVAISGTRVNLILASRVNSGDVVTIAYTKPSTSPLQTSAGSQAESLATRSVTNNVLADIPVYVSSAIREAAPAVIEITYNMSLANVVPATSAFSVLVNSVARSVSGVSIVNGKVLLTLASRVYDGDAIVFSYTKPATSPLQTAVGGQAASISSRTVTNNTGPATPVFVNAVIENATPSNIDITFNITLTGTVPPTSAFAVTVNGSPRTIGSVAIVSGKVRLTLSSRVIVGDVVTVSYTRPASNQLQTIYGGIAESFSARSVINNCVAPVPVFTSASVENNSPSIVAIGFDLSLANVVPATSAFNVQVNSVSRAVTNVAIVGGRVLLVLESSVVYGNVVTVSYTKPATLALQTPSDGEVASFSSRQVTNNCLPPVPTIQSAVVEDATPSVIDISFNTPISTTVPSVEAFTLIVNSTERPVASVSVVSGKLRFTLASPLLFGDLIRISYTSPESNYLQSAANIKSPDFSGVPVTNNILAILPDFTEAFVKESSPGTIVVYFDMVMANVIPSTSSFTVMVNSIVREVSSVVVYSGNVQLILSSGINYGDVITLSYSKPLSNPLQSVLGGHAESFPARTVTNFRTDPNRPDTPPVVNLTYATIYYGGFISEISALTSYDPEGEKLIYEWTAPLDVPVSSLNEGSITFLAPVSGMQRLYRFQVKVTDGRNIVTKSIDVNVVLYRPELAMARISETEASDFYENDYPQKAIDGNLASKWSAPGENNWISFRFAEPFKINHLELSLLPSLRHEAYLDIYASADGSNWTPIIVGLNTCSFSGDRQIIEFPVYNRSIEYSYLKIVGQGNLLNSWNYLTECRVFGTYFTIPAGEKTEKELITLYPNPALYYFNISIEEASLTPDRFILSDFSGKAVIEGEIYPGITTVQLQSNLKSGMYIVTLISDDIIIYAGKLVID